MNFKDRQPEAKRLGDLVCSSEVTHLFAKPKGNHLFWASLRQATCQEGAIKHLAGHALHPLLESGDLDSISDRGG